MRGSGGGTFRWKCSPVSTHDRATWRCGLSVFANFAMVRILDPRERIAVEALTKMSSDEEEAEEGRGSLGRACNVCDVCGACDARDCLYCRDCCNCCEA